MCELTVTGVLGIESVVGNDPDEVRVTGTATDCASVCVKITQTNPVNVTTPEKTVVVDASGNWTVTFREADGDFAQGDFVCGRGNKAVVLAHCCDDPSCDTQFDFETLPCGECPDIANMQVEVAADCNPDGTRTVTFAFDVTPGASGFAIVQLLNDEGIGPEAETVDAPATLNGAMDYPPGDHSASVAVVFPEGCADTIVTFVVPECVSAPACPEIEIATDQSGCDEEGRRSVSIAARVRLASGDPVAASLVQIDAAGDPIDPPLAEGADAGGDLTLNASDLFQADTAPRFRVVVTQPAGCPGATVTVDLPPCEDSTEPPVVPPDDEEPVVPPDDEPPVVPPDDDTVTDGCPWWWLMPLALVLLIGGVVMTVAGACALIGPLALIGSLVGALATIPLTMWAYLCRDCPAMRALLVAGVGAFDVLAIAALVSSATGADSCSAGFLGGALIVSGAVFSLAVPYLLLCVTGCDGLRVTFGVMAGVYGALLLTALVFVLLGMLEVSVVLVFVAAFVAAVALNLVLLPILFLCSDD